MKIEKKGMGKLTAKFVNLRNALLASTEGVKDIEIYLETDGLDRDDAVICSYLILVKVVPGLTAHKREIIANCFQKHRANFHVSEGNLKLEIDDSNQPVLSYD